jgi:hypothetical protein
MQGFDELFRGRARGSRVLSSDQFAIDLNVDAPVLHLREDRTQAEQLILDQERKIFVRPTPSSSPLVKPVT